MSKITTLDKKKVMKFALILFFTGLFIGAFIYLNAAV
jgi:hypothetical protein